MGIPCNLGVRDGFLHVNDVIVTDAIKFSRRHADFNLRANHVQYLGGESACLAHTLDFGVGLGVTLLMKTCRCFRI